MVRNDILGGLKVAMSKGSSLQDAMQSFYNAGYKKEEIEEAAKNLQNQPVIQTPAQNKNPFVPPVSQSLPKPLTPLLQKKQTESPPLNSQLPSKEELSQVFSKQSPLKPAFTPSPVQQTNVKQNVSSYGEKPKIDAFTIILVAILVVLIGILVSVFLFKDQLVQFLNGFLD